MNDYVNGWLKRLSEYIANINNELEKAKVENTRLRELLCELYEDQCDECDRWKYRDRMRELGVEVTE